MAAVFAPGSPPYQQVAAMASARNIYDIVHTHRKVFKKWSDSSARNLQLLSLVQKDKLSKEHYEFLKQIIEEGWLDG